MLFAGNTIGKMEETTGEGWMVWQLLPPFHSSKQEISCTTKRTYPHHQKRWISNEP